MTAQYITILNGKRVGLSAYTQAWKRVKNTDPNIRIPGWSWFEVSAGDILREMRRGLHDRINIRGQKEIRK